MFRMSEDKERKNEWNPLEIVEARECRVAYPPDIQFARNDVVTY